MFARSPFRPNGEPSPGFPLRVIRFWLEARVSRAQMKAIAKCAVVAVLTAMTLSAGVRAEPPVTLTVRLYNTSGIPAPELVAARRAAESILGDTALGPWAFRHCGRRCLTGRPRSIRVTIVTEAVRSGRDASSMRPRSAPTLHPDAYGVAYVVQESGRGWLATVFSDRIPLRGRPRRPRPRHAARPRDGPRGRSPAAREQRPRSAQA